MWGIMLSLFLYSLVRGFKFINKDLKIVCTSLSCAWRFSLIRRRVNVDIRSMKLQRFDDVDYQKWVAEVEKTSKKTIESFVNSTYENLNLKPIYTKEDIKNITRLKEIPGFDSYLRGVDTPQSKEKPWHVSQELNETEPSCFNKELKDDLKNGQSMIHFRLKNKENQKGLLLSTLHDALTAFEHIPVQTIPLNIDANDNSIPILALLKAYCNKKNISFSEISGTIGMDPLCSLVETGSLPQPLSRFYDIMNELIVWTDKEAPNIRPILVKSDPYHNGGADVVKELAYTVATAADYLYECIKRGTDVNTLAPKFTFVFSIGSNFFMEIAKLRAVRVLWSTIVKAYDGDVDARKIHIHGKTSSLTKTMYDRQNNIIRATTEAFAAVLGGVESLHVSPFDELTVSSHSFSRRIARNTQLILQEEVIGTRVADAIGGSYYIEHLTNEILMKSWELFKQIEAKGGMFSSLKSGYIQSEIKKIASLRKQQVRNRKDTIVGINRYANLDEYLPNARKPIQHKQTIPKKCKYKIHKSSPMKSFIEALEHGANIEELQLFFNSKDMQDQVQSIPSFRLAEEIETLRIASDRYQEKNGTRPMVGLFCFGEYISNKDIIDHLIDFFASGGFEVVKAHIQSSDEAMETAEKIGLQCYVFCGKQAGDSKFIDAAKKLLSYNANLILYVALEDTAPQERYKKVGITGCITATTDSYRIFKEMQHLLGVL